MSTLRRVLLFLAATAFSAASVLPAQAQFGEFEVLNQLPRFQAQDIASFAEQDNAAVAFVGAVATFVTAVIIVISLIAIVIAGYIYMTAAGDATRVSKAKTIIVSALLAIVLALAAVLILRTINPDLIPTQDPFPRQ